MTSNINYHKPYRIVIDGMVTPTLRTGVGRYVEGLLVEFGKINLDFDCTVTLGSNQNDLEKVFSKQFTIHRSRISTEKFIFNFLRLQLILPLFCKKRNISLLHIPNEKLVLIKLCPIVVTIHDIGDYYSSKRRNLLRRIYRKISMPIILKRANHIIAVSERTKHDLINIFKINPLKITVIYEGITKIFYNRPLEIKSVHQKLGIFDDFILFVGEINKRKNLELLISAFNAINSEITNKMQLVLVGKDGGEEKKIKKVINDLNLSHKVLLTGYLPDKDLAALYYSAYCLAMPTIYEGFGLPVVEAMACGLPVIVSNTGALPEITGNAGFIVDCTNSDSLSKALIKIVNDADFYNDLKLKGLKRAKLFDWNYCAEKTLRVYKLVLNHF